MRTLIVWGSGIRKSELELTDCEIKDLAIALTQLVAEKAPTAQYGCISVYSKTERTKAS